MALALGPSGAQVHKAGGVPKGLLCRLPGEARPVSRNGHSLLSSIQTGVGPPGGSRTGPQGCRQLLVTKGRERKNGKRIQHAKEGEADKGELVEEASTLPAPPRSPPRPHMPVPAGSTEAGAPAPQGKS